MNYGDVDMDSLIALDLVHDLVRKLPLVFAMEAQLKSNKKGDGNATG
jgi:hypothetical protein